MYHCDYPHHNNPFFSTEGSVFLSKTTFAAYDILFCLHFCSGYAMLTECKSFLHWILLCYECLLHALKKYICAYNDVKYTISNGEIREVLEQIGELR